MSSSRGSSLPSSLMNKVTPECQNLGKSLKLTGIATLAAVILIIILSAIALVYLYKDNKEDPVTPDANDGGTTTTDSNKKISMWLTIGTFAAAIIAGGIGLWNVTVSSKAAKTCIS